ncbi:AraC family transcriptional regulator [Pseudomonas aeruginosa]|uniref:helix-turn-helix domain-containing protein n=1 Tax=Pseudomonas aeruginosa TaxID=287 RepID=UPI00104D1500|nr:AraC family transcriptional regulator [Pseudomonas aeruginosa]
MEQITHLSSGIPGVRLIDAEHNRFSFPRHFHLEYHIGLLLQGRHRYAAGGERRLAGAGDALLMAPESIHDGSSAGEEGYRIRVLACLLSLGSSLRLEEGDREGFGQRDWTRLRDWLESRLEYPPNLEELAAFCGLSPWQVLRRFRRHCGLPPHQWLTQLRLERALPLVLRGEQPLSQVAQQFGFYDQAHFSRLFRRTYGLPPARLRQR